MRLKSLLFFLLFLVGTQVFGQQQKPNILLIISDDQGYHDLGSFGNKDILTPYLDQLAAEGVRLTNFYVTSSACTPSRSGLLTGRYPQRNGTFELFRNNMVNYGHRYTEYEYSVSPERILGTDLREIFISEVLKKGGYTNGYVGKWDLGQLKRYLPMQQGYDKYYGFANTGIDYFTHERYGSPSMIDGNYLSIADKGTYTTDLFEREALEFINESEGKPFFLTLAFNAPHSASNLDPEIKGTVQATEKYLKMYPESNTKRGEKQRAYKAAVTQMDQSIGNIMERIKELGQEENTLVIFLSDNGGMSLADNYPLRGGKAQFFEGGIRVPCLVKWPGKIEAGQTNEAFLTSLELFPMMVAAAGLELPEEVIYDGFDMLPVLRGKVEVGRKEMFWDFRGDQAARVGDWKWVQSAKGNGLFDLKHDIGEQNDLSLENPEKLVELTRKFSEWKEEMGNAAPRGPFKDY
ncbi:sulfatase-like hydrolase/transferase [uncultured Cyclobacterium sp.]|uniref:sulfatase-like hydrolase/transferase n=1 Tax=uncultured Cyclobacterium sp. TaxID=453820 RepID=UPI0030EBD3ED